MGKSAAGFSFGFIHILIFSLLIHLVIQSEDFQKQGRIFPYLGREALAKKSFFGAGKIRESCRLKAMEAKVVSTLHGKHFT